MAFEYKRNRNKVASETTSPKFTYTRDLEKRKQIKEQQSALSSQNDTKKSAGPAVDALLKSRGNEQLKNRAVTNQILKTIEDSNKALEERERWLNLNVEEAFTKADFYDDIYKQINYRQNEIDQIKREIAGSSSEKFRANGQAIIDEDKRYLDYYNKELRSIAEQYGWSDVNETVLRQEAAKIREEARKAEYLQQGKKLRDEALAAPDFETNNKYGTEVSGWLIGDKDYIKNWLSLTDYSADFYDAMTEEEKKILGYYLATGDEGLNEGLKWNQVNQLDELKYLNYIKEEVDQRRVEGIYNEKDTALKKLLFSGEVGLEQFVTGAKGAYNALIGKDEYIPRTATQMASQKIKEDIKNSEGFENKALGFAYDIGVTSTNMLPSILVGLANPAAGAVLMGTTAGGNAYNEMINEGRTWNEAVAYGSLVGVSETTLERMLGGVVGKEKLVGVLMPKLKKAAARVSVQMGESIISEFTEESLQTVLEPFFETLVTGVDYNAPDIEEVLYSGLLGAVSGGMFSGGNVGGTSIINTVMERAQIADLGETILDTDNASENIKSLIDNAQQSDNKKLQKAANKVAKTEQNGTYDVSARKVGRLAQLSQEQLARTLDETATGRDMKSQAVAKMTENGMKPKEAGKVFDLILSDAPHNKPSMALESIMEKNSSVRPIYEQMVEYLSKEAIIKRYEDTQKASPITKISESIIDQRLKDADIDVVDDVVDESGEIDNIDSVVNVDENGNYILKRESGETFVYDKLSDNLPNVDENTANKVAYAVNFSANGANAYVKLAPNNATPQYKAEFTTIYNQGATNKAFTQIESDIPSEVQKAIYEAGKADFEAAKQRRQKAETEAKEREASFVKKEMGFKSDRVTVSEAALAKLKAAKKDGKGKQYKAAVEVIDNLAKMLQVNINIVASETDSSGRYIGANGQYNRATNTFTFDITSGMDNVADVSYTAMIKTAGHELTHFIQNWSPSKYLTLKNTTLKFLTEEHSERWIEQQLKRIKADNKAVGKNLTLEQAKDELVADAFEDVLGNIDFAETVLRTDKTLFDKIHSWVKKNANDFKKNLGIALKDVKAQTGAGLTMKEAGERAQALYNEWSNAFSTALENSTSFNMGQAIEQNKDLVAFHNITAEQLRDAVERNNLLMPSIAISNKAISEFGEISIVFDKSTIDPKLADNKLFGSDAWTPTRSELKKNAKFDRSATEAFVKRAQDAIGSRFDYTAQQLEDAIFNADGSIYNAFASDPDMQAIYAAENGIAESEIEATLDSDNGWRQYKKWLNGISDELITSYDSASNEEIISDMKSQPATAKPFKLSENGELVVPVAEYSSIEDLRKNKNRLSENADEQLKTVGEELLSWAKDISLNSDATLRKTVSAINNTFDSRYSIPDIVRSFKRDGIDISRQTASELQSLYKKAVELPTRYFEAKPQRAVSLSEIKAIVMPENGNMSDLESHFNDMGIEIVKYTTEQSRIDALNSLDNVKFQTRRAAKEQDTALENSTSDSMVDIDASTESVAPQYSARTWTGSEYVQKRNEAAKEIAEALGVSVAKAKNYIDNINSIAKIILDARTRLDYEASTFGSAFVSNVEYGGSFDFTTLCKKRRIYTGTFTEIQKRLRNTALSPDEILKIRNMMIERGIEATCGLCYVEGSRANMGKFAKEFIRLYKRDNPDAWIPDMADVNTPDGVESMRINHPEAYEQYEYFWNHYGKLQESDPALFASQQKPKLYEARKEYKGEILERFEKGETVEKKNRNGGIRMQSFSDFEIVHLIDTMQIIMDMSRVGLAGQAYTKVPEFAKAFGSTGLKINLSLIAKGVDADGRLIFDDREGMPHETAFDLRNKYSANVGTIIVTFTDEQLMAAMADDRIDFIIPFHRSQWKKGQYGAMGLPKGTKDYTFMQNEKLIKPTYHEYRGRMVKDKATNYMPNEYWDFSKSGKENAEAYLEMCAENNKRPKFYKLLDYDGNGKYSLKKDGSTDGYWKLLIDFKMYDNRGKGSPQKAVVPNFNMEESVKMLDEYKGGHQSYPVAYDVVDAFVEEYSQGKDTTQLSARSAKRIDSALETFGTTTDVEKAGFAIPDGRMLNLSKYGLRGTNHKLIEAVFEDVKGNAAVNAFIQEGNVRLKAAAPGVEIGETIAPTTAQLNAVSRLIRNTLYERGRFYLDITAEDGSSIASVEYGDRDSIQDILYDIKAYYDRGKIPVTQKASAYSYYSARNTNKNYLDVESRFDVAESVLKYADTVSDPALKAKLKANATAYAKQLDTYETESIRYDNAVANGWEEMAAAAYYGMTMSKTVIDQIETDPDFALSLESAVGAFENYSEETRQKFQRKFEQKFKSAIADSKDKVAYIRNEMRAMQRDISEAERTARELAQREKRARYRAKQIELRNQRDKYTSILAKEKTRIKNALEKPTENASVPKDTKGIADKVLDVINAFNVFNNSSVLTKSSAELMEMMISVGNADMEVRKNKTLLARTNASDSVLRNLRYSFTQVKATLDSLAAEYEKLSPDYKRKNGEKAPSAAASIVYDETLHNALKELSKDFSAPELVFEHGLGFVYEGIKVIRAMNHQLLKANQMYVKGKSFEVLKLRNRLYNDIDTASPFLNKFLGNALASEVLMPKTMLHIAFGATDNADVFYNMLDDGQMRYIRFINGAKDIFAPVEKEIENEIFKSDTPTLKTGLKYQDGTDVLLNYEFALSFIKIVENPDSLRHAVWGGLQIPDLKPYNKGDKKTSYNSQRIVEHAQPKSAPELMTDEDIAKKLQDAADKGVELTNEEYLDMYAEQIAWNNRLNLAAEIEAKYKAAASMLKEQMSKTDTGRQALKMLSLMTKYYDEYARKYLNEATMELYGFEKTLQEGKTYYPIRVMKTEKESNDNVDIVRDYSLENWGAMKHRVESKKGIELYGALTELESYMENTAKYYAWTNVTKNMKKILNTQIIDNDGTVTTLVSKINKLYGSYDPEAKGLKRVKNKFMSGFETYMKDLQSEIVGANKGGEKWTKLQGAFVTNALLLNVSTPMVQFSATNLVAVDSGYLSFIKTVGKSGEIPGLLSEAQKKYVAKYSEVYKYRSGGLIDIDLAAAKANKNVLSKALSSKALAWTESADSQVLGKQFYALLDHVKRTHKGISAEEAAQIAGKQLDQTIYEFQANYTVLQRAPLLRGSGIKKLMLGTFRTQQITMLNAMIDSSVKTHTLSEQMKRVDKDSSEYKSLQRKHKDALARSYKVYVAVALSNLCNAVIRMGVGVLRRKDDEEKLKTAWIDFLDSYMTMVPLFGDIASYLIRRHYGETYYGDKVFSLGLLDMLSDAIESGYDIAEMIGGGEDQELSPYIKELINVCAPIGVPARNVYNIIKMVLGWSEEAADAAGLSWDLDVDEW